MAEKRTSVDWESAPTRELMRLSWPIAIAMLSYSAMTLVDTIFVGHLGASALAGVGIAGVVSFTILSFGLGLLRAVKVLVSQAVGAKRRELVPTIMGAGLLLALILGVIFIALGEGVALWIPSFSASADAGTAASTYLAIRILGAPLNLCFAATKEGRYGVGDSKSAMVASIVGNIVNIAFDALFIFVLEMGVAGAAWASLIATTSQLALITLMAKGEGWSHLRLGTTRALALLRIGVPTGLQFTMEMSAFLAMSIVLSLINEVEMAAHQIALQVMHFGFLPAIAVADAVSVLAGQAVGADRFPLVRRVARDGAVLISIYSAAFALVLVFGAPEIASVFTESDRVTATVISLLHLAAIFQVVDGWQMIARGALRGTGDVRVPAILGIAIAWLITPPTTWFVGMKLGYGAWGGWLGITIQLFVAGLVFWHRFLSNRWHEAARSTRGQL